MHEVELKFLLDEAGEKHLRKAVTASDPAAAQARPGGGAAAPSGASSAAEAAGTKTARLLTRYHDTPDGALGRAGMALRLRREGRRWTQTVKIRSSLRAGLSSASEANTPAPGGRIDLSRIEDEALRRTIEDAAGGAELLPVFETDIRRTTAILSPDGTSRVELAIDSGEVRAGEHVRPLREAEFELVEGDPAALFAAARAVMPPGAIRFSTLSKAERGALLARSGRIEPEPEPRKARRPPLSTGMTAEAAASETLAECFDQVAANIEAIRASDHPEGPHQLRVGLRRLRTALKLFRAPLGGERLDALAAEAQWLGREVGELRDLDVALADLIAPAAARAPGEPGFAVLSREVERRAGLRRAALRETLDGTRVRAFVLDLAEFVALRGWLDPADHDQTARLAEPVAALAARELDRALRRVARRAKGIDELGIEQRHELRKALKTLRYAIEFFAPLWPRKKVKAMLGPLRELQDLFGALNDAAMAEALFLGPEAPAGTDPAACRAAGRIIGAESLRAEIDWYDVRARWTALKKVDPFWR